MTDLIRIGWVPLDASGTPIRPHRSGYSWQTNLTHPPRIYTTEGRAKAQGVYAAEVFIKELNVVQD